jgi:class 3 adenylate cyclase
MELPEIGTIRAFALVLDINGFTPIVSKASQSDCIAQFVRDVLTGGIEAVERQNGFVVSFMGDAFLAVLGDAESTFKAAAGIAACHDDQCEYISDGQREYPGSWKYCIGGPSLKIGIEYGWIDISTIQSKLLGKQRLLIGPAINCACRITTAGVGNRCNIGPEAMKNGMNIWWTKGPFLVDGKIGEGEYEYWSLNLTDVWREGMIGAGEATYHG